MQLPADANMSGKEKLNTLMIGKSKSPRCFKGMKFFILHYKGNKKAWMTSEYIEGCYKQINKNMCKKEENCTFHLQMKNSWHHLRIERGASSFSCTKHYLKAASSLTRDRSFKIGLKEIVKKIVHDSD